MIDHRPPGTHPSRSPSVSACEPFRDLIELGLSRGRNAMAIWQDLVDQHGFKSRRSERVRRFKAMRRILACSRLRMPLRSPLWPVLSRSPRFSRFSPSLRAWACAQLVAGGQFLRILVA